jgi:hypothetical protein
MLTNIRQSADKFFITAGLVLLALGSLALFIGRWGSGGQLLPGDIVVKRPGVAFYLPMVSCLVLSLLLSRLLTVVALLWRR